ncbi:GtrA family protein [Paenibacillus sp. FSL R5-0744]|uniref:GtrA family protein n=1 Tax=Paenibacillus sp. FSL R5-0744 TaxID=2921656 RepID=UPI0030DC542C
MKVERDHHTSLMKFINKPFIRFVISGFINTGATYIIYLVLLSFWEYKISYTVSYISGIFISYYLNTIFVFQEKASFQKFLKFPVVYIVQYLINLLFIFLLVDKMGLSTAIVPIIVTIIAIPITFLLSKTIITTRK